MSDLSRGTKSFSKSSTTAVSTLRKEFDLSEPIPSTSKAIQFKYCTTIANEINNIHNTSQTIAPTKRNSNPNVEVIFELEQPQSLSINPVRNTLHSIQPSIRPLEYNYAASQSYVPKEIDVDYLGPMNVVCRHCDVLHFKDEKVAGQGLS